ncbi:inorganic phosphate transporter [Desulfovibrio litoralis]|uniref:Phosphate transporter n=1 Tax=Desulfovibrio litoralis DSM 11393 TaxID=1121455 RepID=A0A1M7TKF4_9BACT|nr:inorganic phosphate transporter [Desulfovibrio litoralis]SHN71219.1 inorganic phosphate transporter, PiT family [Desulfovibrio litoralis DSM 11393]
MDSFALLFLSFAGFAGFLMAFSLGANDVANSMASAVGAKAITVRQAVVIASVLNIVGAVFLGSHVTSTISNGIIHAGMIPDAKIIMIGMLASLLSAGLWVLVATFTGLPVSSTHSIIGSIIGFGIVAGGVDAIQWKTITYVILSWVVSPFFGALIAFLVFSQIRRSILYSKEVLAKARFWAPWWVGLTVTLVVLSFCYKTPYGKSLHLGLFHGIIIFIVSMGITILVSSYYLDKTMPKRSSPERSKHAIVESLFRRMQMGTACYVAVSQGANDVANAVAPVAAIYVIATTGSLGAKVDVPTWLLLMGGVGIALGIVLLGYKVMSTVGEKITKMNNTRGFAVAFSSATTVLMASNLGLPVSTTHAAVGSVVGVGLARGFAAVDFRVLGKIVLYWLLTLPIAAFTSIVIFYILRLLFL